MASPFTVFRKHQKLMLAILTILAMFGFVFLPIILQGMGMRSVKNPVIVSTTRFGDLKEYDLYQMIQQRQSVRRFLDRIRRAVVQAGGEAQRVGRVEQRIGPAREQAVVQTWLMAQHARRLGVVISKKAINAFIRELSEDRVRPYQLKTILNSMRLSQLQLFEMLRHELLAMRFQDMFLGSLDGTPPEQRWDYFTRLKRQAAIEAVPVRVADFVDYESDPGDAVLEPFFEAHKQRYPNPYEPTPGFREPKRIAVRYFKADYERFASPETISDEEVLEEYEANKELYDRLGGSIEEEPEEAEGPGKPTVEESAPKGGEGPETTPPSNPASDEGAGPPPGDTAKPAADAQKPADSEDAPDESNQSSVGTDTPFRLTAFQDAEDEAKEPDEGQAEGVTAPEGPELAPAAPDNSEPAEENAQAAEAGEDGERPEAGPSAGGVPEEIASLVRQALARRKAPKRFEEALIPIRDAIDRYRNARARYLAEKEMGMDASPPKEPDYEALAKRQGLSTGVTPLVSAWEIQEHDVGKSRVDGRIPLPQYAYERSWDDYLPETSVDLRGNQYLVWKIDETEERIPEFTDRGVRDKVLKAWRFVQAREKARKQAEELADEARKAGKPLIAVFVDRPELSVIAPDPFSWLTQGLVPSDPRNPPRLSNVGGIDSPGEEFMRTVFSLDQGEVGVAFNQPKSVAYLIQVIEVDPPRDALWAMFTSEPYTTYASVAVAEQRRIYWAWLDELQKSAGLKWERPPQGAGVE